MFTMLNQSFIAKYPHIVYVCRPNKSKDANQNEPIDIGKSHIPQKYILKVGTSKAVLKLKGFMS